MSHFVACLDVWAPAVREVVRRVAPAELDLHFATTYDDAEQMGAGGETPRSSSPAGRR